MTLYEPEYEPCESTTTSTIECDFLESYSMSYHKLENMRTTKDTRVAHTSTRLGTTENEPANAMDVEHCLDDICEQLDSVDMIRDTHVECTEQTGIHDVAKETGATAMVPSFENVFVQDRDGDTMLHMAIIHLKMNFAMYFINLSPTNTWLNLKNHLYQTAIHLAVLTKQYPVLRRLMVGGADIEARDHKGNTPLHLAAQNGFTEGVKALLEPVRYIETKQNSYDIPYQRIPQNLEITNYEGLTALHLAAENNRLDIVKILIQKQVDVNSRDVKSGRSILHKACNDGNLELIRLLLKCKDCDINLRTYDDSTPFDIARARRYERITFELAVAGAKIANEQEEYD